jgi:hypothetical protein
LLLEAALLLKIGNHLHHVVRYLLRAVDPELQYLVVDTFDQSRTPALVSRARHSNECILCTIAWLKLATEFRVAVAAEV